jgi:SNF2 family DNA or RNA helicase
MARRISADLSSDGLAVLIKFGFHPDLIRTVKSFPSARLGLGGAWLIERSEFNQFAMAVGPSEIACDPSLLAALPDDPFEASKPSYVLPDLRPLKPTWAELNLPGQGLTATDYQATGTSYIVLNKNALVMDEMGLGKSKECIDAITYAHEHGERMSKVLIVAKASSLGNWRNELRLFAPPSDVHILRGKPMERLTRLRLLEDNYTGTMRFCIVSWAMLLNMRSALQDSHWDAVVLDEAHLAKSTPLNNAQSNRAQAIHGLRAQRKIAMTGTFIINSAEDSWNVLTWLGVETRGWDEFERDTLVTIRYNKTGYHELKMVVNYKSAGLIKLRAMIGANMIRRLKSEELPALPPFIRTDIDVMLNSEEITAYKLAEKQLQLKVIDSSITRTQNIAALSEALRLKQITSDIGVFRDTYYTSSKVAACVELVESIVGSGRKVLIGTQFRSVLDSLARHLAEYNPAIVHGGISTDAKPGHLSPREQEVERFQCQPKCQVFLASVAACREAINLTAASAIIHIDKEWSPEYTAQFEARAQRIGSEVHNAINVYSLIARLPASKKHRDGVPTIDSGIETLHDAKSEHAATLTEKTRSA